MQGPGKLQDNSAGCRRISSSSVTLVGATPSEQLRGGTPQGNEDDVCTYNSGDHGSSMTNVQEDDFVLPELLPSFEMYENLHSSIPQSSFDAYFHENPPYYEAASSTWSDASNDESRPDTQVLGDDNADPENRQTTADTRQLASDSTNSSASRVSNHEGAKGIPVERIYALPRVDTPITIELFVTKSAPKFGQSPQYESILKEYTSGDIIHGYFTVENKSVKPIKFDMFYLTLEGQTSSKTKTPFGVQKTSKIFLRMVDMAASWSYNQEDVNTGEDLFGFYDSVDETRFGLPNDRTLNPGDKRKKFFTFKIPNQLLDITCKHRHFSHSLLPPTLGFDRPQGSHAELSTPAFSESLGYGRLSERGSSLLLDDSSGNSLIGYSIKAMIVGKDVTSGNVCLMSEQRYSIRIVPFGFHCNPVSKEKCLKDLEDFNISIAKSLGRIERVFSKLKREAPIYEEDIWEMNDSGVLPYSKSKYLWNPVVSNVKNQTVEKKHPSEENIVESEMTYSISSVFNTNIRNVFLKGMHNTPLSHLGKSSSRMTSGKHGLITIKVKPPEKSLSYWSPNLIRKKNLFSTKSRQNQQNWLTLKSLLSVEEQEELNTLQIELVCVQAANSIPHAPPEISRLQTELICLTTNTEDCKPVELHTDFLLNKQRFNQVKNTFQGMLENIEAHCDNFTENQTKINSLLVEDAKVRLHGRPLVFSDFMPLNTLKEVKALAHMDANAIVVKYALKTKLVDEKDIHTDSSPASGTILRASRKIIKTAPTNCDHPMISHQKSSKWNRVSATEYRKKLFMSVKYNDCFRATVVPSFENCLCSRSYFFRVKFHFDKGAGTSEIDIPVQIKNSLTQ